MNMGFENQINNFEHRMPGSRMLPLLRATTRWGWHFCWAPTYQWCWCLMYSFLLNCYCLYQEISAKACGNPQTISIGLITGPPASAGKIGHHRDPFPAGPPGGYYMILWLMILGKTFDTLGRLILVTAIWSGFVASPILNVWFNQSTFTREYSEQVGNHIERISPGRPVACRGNAEENKSGFSVATREQESWS